MNHLDPDIVKHAGCLSSQQTLAYGFENILEDSQGGGHCSAWETLSFEGPAAAVGNLLYVRSHHSYDKSVAGRLTSSEWRVIVDDR